MRKSPLVKSNSLSGGVGMSVVCRLEQDTGAKLSGPEWTQTGIAWDTDINDKFQPTESTNLHNRRTPEENKLVTDPDFIVWMRTAGLPTFRKLYR